MNLPRFAVTHRSFVLAILLLALFWSLASFLGLQRREDPEVTQRVTEIVTFFPGATTENVEQLVTKKIADQVRSVDHVLHVTGISRPGISDINVEFDDVMTNADGPLRDVRNKIDDARAGLPAGVQGPSIVEDAWLTYPLVVGITARDLTERQLRDISKNLADALATLPDVALVQMVGAQEQQVNVDVNLRSLSAYGVTLGDLQSAVEQRNALIPNGTLSLGDRLAQLRPGSEIANPGDVAQAPVATIGGRLVRVGDVAKVGFGYPDPPQELVHTNGRRAVALAIRVKEGSSVTTLGPEVQSALAQAKEKWPAGVEYTLIADQPRTVSERVADFFANLTVGVVVVTILVALLMGLRNGLLVGATVLLSIVLVFGLLPFLHVDINQMSILALIIALGVIVDAGIVSIDNIERRLREGMPRTEAGWRGVGELWLPLLTSTLVAMTSFLPFRLMGGVIGDFVRDLAIVTTNVLLVSLIVAYFITPILGELFARSSELEHARGFGARVRATFDGVLEHGRNAYVPIARWALRNPLLTVGAAFGGVVVAALCIPMLGLQFFPSADRNQFFIDVTAPDGTDIRSTEAIVTRVESILAQERGITNYGSFIGRGAPRFYYNVLSEQPKPSYAQILVNTTDAPAANRLVEELRPKVGLIPGARIDVKKLEQGPPVGTPIQVRLASENANALPAAAAALRERLRAIGGAVAVRDSLGEPTTSLSIDIDENRAALTGVSEAALRSLIATAYGGTTASDIRERDRQTPIVLRLPEQLRGDPSAIAGMSVRAADGTPVPVGELAKLRLDTQTSSTTIRDGFPTVTVSADVGGRLASAVLADFRKSISDIELPAGVTLKYAGEDEQTIKAFTNLLVAAVVGLMINQIILLWEFRSLRLTLVVLAAIPLGLIGSVLGLAITGNHFGFIAFLGLASLGGIVTNHTIVLFEYARRETEENPDIEPDEALIQAGQKRLRPIVLTVVTSIAGLLPLAFSSQSLWHPFCWVVIFGLASSMLMTLIVIPALYRLTAGSKLRLRLPLRVPTLRGHVSEPRELHSDL